MADDRMPPHPDEGLPLPSPPPAPDPNPAKGKLKKRITYGCLMATMGILAALLGLLVCFWIARTYMAMESELQNAQELQKKYDQLYKDAQLMQLRNTVYREIMKKWQLNIPGDTELATFSIDDYFCKVWCPWYQINLPKVRQEYKESNCNACQTAKPAARPQPKPRIQREVHREPPMRESRPIRIVNPPPPPREPERIYTPPPPPVPVYEAGPTAGCP